MFIPCGVCLLLCQYMTFNIIDTCLLKFRKMNEGSCKFPNLCQPTCSQDILSLYQTIRKGGGCYI